MIDVLNEVFTRLGLFYQGVRVFQDSGMWLVPEKQIAEYLNAKVELAQFKKARKRAGQ